MNISRLKKSAVSGILLSAGCAMLVRRRDPGRRPPTHADDRIRPPERELAVSDLRKALRNTAVQGWSSPATLRVVADLVSGLDWKTAKVCDVGAGRGDFTRMLGQALKNTLGLDPAEHIFACDLLPESYGYDAVPCRATGADGRLPFDDDQFDVVISVEVIEHVENQFEFMRELARVTRPGGQVIVTTPNVLNVNSRIRTLLWGFPGLYDPLPIGNRDPRRLAGHIHPISPYFLAYQAAKDARKILQGL